MTPTLGTGEEGGWSWCSDAEINERIEQSFRRERLRRRREREAREAERARILCALGGILMLVAWIAAVGLGEALGRAMGGY